jgi:hypothetical protein
MRGFSSRMSGIFKLIVMVGLPLLSCPGVIDARHLPVRHRPR